MSELGPNPYDFCLRFFVELQALGVTDVVVSPGSRSAPLAMSAQAVGLNLTVQIDERVAAFHALGLARVTRRPPVLVCTSGTAAANYHPAVIEAHHSSIPLIVCTADRPPELRLWGAGQTIDQNNLYGSSVRWFHEVSVGGEVADRHAGSLALRAVHEAAGGPVHLNWPFREPLHPTTELEPPPARLSASAPAGRSGASEVLSELGEAHECGLIVVGPADVTGDVATELLGFAHRYGWPVIADPASGLRNRAGEDALIVSTGEFLFSSAAFVAALPACDVVVRIGSSPTSKAYRLWLESHRPAELVLVEPGVEWSDPTDSTTAVVSGPLEGLFTPTPDALPRESAWLDLWGSAEQLAAAAIRFTLMACRNELTVVESLLDQLEAKGTPVNLVVSSSMPIRHLDAVMRGSDSAVRVIANRGANGIDGVVATAGGVAAATGMDTVLLIGDVATLHDLGGLAAVARLGLHNLTIVVIDNHGGRIFDFLPIAGVAAPETFAKLFTTAHGTDLAAIGLALGFTVSQVALAGDFDLVEGRGVKSSLVVVETAAADTVATMADLRQAVNAAFA